MSDRENQKIIDDSLRYNEKLLYFVVALIAILMVVIGGVLWANFVGSESIWLFIAQILSGIGTSALTVVLIFYGFGHFRKQRGIWLERTRLNEQNRILESMNKNNNNPEIPRMTQPELNPEVITFLQAEKVGEDEKPENESIIGSLRDRARKPQGGRVFREENDE